MDIGKHVNDLLASIVSQYAGISWLLLSASVGIAEAYNNRLTQLKVKEPINALYPMLLGAIFGVLDYFSKVKWGVDGFFHITFNTLKSAAIYGGFVPIVYIVTLKPFKAFVALLQSKVKS